MKLNVKPRTQPVFNHAGQKATSFKAEKELKRAVLSCMLWENSFYENGEEISTRIRKLIAKVDPVIVGALAIDARTKYKLRHVPLLMVREMARIDTHKKYVADVLEAVIQRADELTEFLAIYWKEGRQPLSAQVKKGLARAFKKFDAHQLAKYNRDGAVKLRDVLFLSHSKPVNKAQGKDWKKLVEGKLSTPDTWETQLSAGKDKGETFTRLINEEKLGGLAMLRNLRNMIEARVSSAVIKKGISNIDTKRIFPFRFITAAKFGPAYEPQLEQKLFECLGNRKKLDGKTVILVDVSGSMEYVLSTNSEATRIVAGCGLAIMARELCEDVAVYSFSDALVQISSRRGFALAEAINKSQRHNGTALYDAVKKLKAKEDFDRLIIITDEQSTDSGRLDTKNTYVLNVAGASNGVNHSSAVTRIDGWSEAVLDYIAEVESESNIH